MRIFPPEVWAELHEAAGQAMRRAYAPYSRFPVGAAALTADGRVVTGCNVENSSYGLSLCAECGLVSDLARSGGGELVAFVCVDARGDRLAPCGRCRQLLREFSGPGLVLDMPAGPATLEQILPDAFGPADIDRVTGEAEH